MVNSFLTFFWPVETSEVHAHSSGIIVLLHGFIPSPSHQGRVQISLSTPYKLLTGDLMFYFKQSKHEKFDVSVPSSRKLSRVQAMPSIVWSPVKSGNLGSAWMWKEPEAHFCSLSTQFLAELGSYILQPVLGLGEFQGELPINQIFIWISRNSCYLYFLGFFFCIQESIASPFMFAWRYSSRES